MVSSAEEHVNHVELVQPPLPKAFMLYHALAKATTLVMAAQRETK